MHGEGKKGNSISTEGAPVNDEHRYDDMLDMPHHVSPKRPKMSLHDRAAQFAPFAALTGFGAAITESDRVTERRIELGEAEAAELTEKMRILQARQSEQPEISVTWFVPDARKEGGRYEVAEGRLRRVVPDEYTLMFADGRSFDLDSIIYIDGEMFEGMRF